MSETHEVEMAATVNITLTDREPILRVIGPGGDEWRRQLFSLHTEADVLEHWAFNAVSNGVKDVSELDGWADVPEGTVVFRVYDVEPTS